LWLVREPGALWLVRSSQAVKGAGLLVREPDALWLVRSSQAVKGAGLWVREPGALWFVAGAIVSSCIGPHKIGDWLAMVPTYNARYLSNILWYDGCCEQHPMVRWPF
jgi:hypothetical protein